MNALFRCLSTGLILLAPLAGARGGAPHDDAQKPAPAKKQPDLYDEKADARQDIANAVARAAQSNRRVLLQWGGNWCPWCIRLHDLCRRDKDIAKKLSYEYDVVYVDSVKGGKNLDLAAAYGADLKQHGVPYLTLLGADGKVLAHQETGVLEVTIDGQAGHDPKLVLEFLEKYQAPYLQADDLFKAALARAKSDGKRVLLHFGAPWCVWCKRLEAWLEKPEIEAILAKDCIELEIDTERTIGGAALLERFRPGAKGIPWFAFLDAQGTVLSDSGQGQENIGFPTTAEEIEGFAGMLEKARQRITAEDVETLKRSLVPPAKKPN